MYKGRKISHKRPWPQWNPEIYKINYRYNSLLQCIEKHTLCWYTCNIGRKINDYEGYYKPTFICMQEIFARFVRAFSKGLFLAANQFSNR